MAQRVLNDLLPDADDGTWRAQATQRARQRAIAFLIDGRYQEARTADGTRVGLQALLASGPGPDDGLDLQAMAPGMRLGEDTSADGPGGMAEDLRLVLAMVESKLGFPLEPELFSNMLAGAYLGADPDPAVAELARGLADVFASTEVDGQYHFFTSLRFACDTDCTGVAAKALLCTGLVDPATASGAAWLGRITDALLRSACVTDVAALENESHGKDNGALVANVVKVYWDDHRVQGAECDRGLKINPVVCANALFPILWELRAATRDPEQTISLREHTHANLEPRIGAASVAEIVRANLDYLERFLTSGEWRAGCRYYPSPDAFLSAYSESIAEFPELFAGSTVRALQQAILERRASISDDPATDPRTSLNSALRAIAASNVGVDAGPEQDVLVALQSESGSYDDPGYLYAFGRASSVPVHFRSRALTTALAVRALRDDPRRPHARDVGWVRALSSVRALR